MLDEKVVLSDGGDHGEVECEIMGAPIGAGARYISRSRINEEMLTVSFGEEGIQRSSAHDINPLVFYRLARPLRDENRALLPEIDLEKLYGHDSENRGFALETNLDYSYSVGREIIERTEEQFREHKELIDRFNQEYDKELLERLEEHIMENYADKDAKELNAYELNLDEFSFRNKKLKKLSDASKRKRIDVFLQFNSYFLDVLPFIGHAKSKLDKSKALDRLTTNFLNSKELILLNVKNQYLKKVMQTLPQGGGARVKVLRRDA